MKPNWVTFAQRPVPRYTSYPTAADFAPAVGEGESRAWAAGVAPGSAISVYAHIPFCERLCWYCGCATTVPNGYGRIAAYVGVLHKEVDLWAEALGPHGGLAHLHLGGGSPNSLSADDMGGLIGHISRRFGLRPDAEIAMELDPRVLSEAQVKAMAAAGVNRVSLGVQTLSAQVQTAINRLQPREQVERVIACLNAAGISQHNMDLMYGLPGQTVSDVEEAAAFAVLHNAARVSVFGYAHVPWFAKHQAAIREDMLPDIAARFAQAEAASAILLDAGYVPVGLDHFARADDSLAIAASAGRLRRNFQGYTDDPCDTLVGLGTSSISQFSEGYVQNLKDRNAWRDEVEAGRLPSERGVVMTEDDRLRARAIERLMCDLRVDVNAVCAEMGAAPDALDDALETARFLVPAGLCTVDRGVVTVPFDARVMLRTVAQCFDGRFKPAPRRHAKAV
ncbi:MAG: coproporphyrinogen III oxidase [Hyphomonas sp. BRH_c22]|uniref:oxygen-independent coproporphyrinogen III oxidase n=1 Tax=Hyphomonas sp. BRH_c22 TaxID=1629710 RepID=UPI0005F239CB|nr:oxygen-independent coproporphyrinogen III oxidase [Hyphomonas sp. BRH_c22]KJS38304.1 MAG: coproporphyrinogen III oxidase [Hyphomonas sp. BRH_c22]